MNFFIGVDLHKSQFTCYFMNETEKGKWMKFDTSEKGFQQFINLLLNFKNEGWDIQTAVESTGNTRYFKNRLNREGISVKIINTMKFKVVNESANKTDKRDAKTIAEFLQKDMLPEAKLCSEESENLRRLTGARKVLVDTRVKMKNKVHGILLGMGVETKNGQLNSKKGRQEISRLFGIVEPLINIIESLEENIKEVDKKIEEMTEADRTVEILKSIPGTGNTIATVIRAHIDSVDRFAHYKKLSAYCGLVPWVKCSDKKEYLGNITKRGPIELRTAIVQMVLGMVRCKDEKENVLMKQYQDIKKRKGSGKAIIAVARKMTKLIWTLLKNDEEYDPEKMSTKYVVKKAMAMRKESLLPNAA